MKRILSLMGKMLTIILILGSFLLLQDGARAADEEKWDFQGPFKWVPYRAGNQEDCIKREVTKRYDSTNVDEIKDMLPEITYDFVKHPEKWGPFFINLTPYEKYPGPKGYAEATEKYKGTCKVDEQGLLRNWWAGTPFPEPKTGWEVIWNFEKKAMGDDIESPYVNAVTDGEHNVHHFNVGSWFRYYFVGRYAVPPMPESNPNPKPFWTEGDDGVELIDTFGYWDPYDLRGLVPRYYRYKDPFKNDDMWMYIPAMRRVRRMSTAQRMDTIGGGSDCTWDDFLGFSGKVMQYNWKLLGKKEMISPRFCKPKAEWVYGNLLVPVDDWYQKMELFMVECTPKDPNHIYSKKISYVDPEAWTLPYNLFYDAKGNLWKYFSFHFSYDKNWVQYPEGMTIIDLQRMHGVPHGLFDCNANLGRTPDDFTLDALRKKYSGR